MKQKGKSKKNMALKIFGIIIAVILVISIVAVIVINVMTKPEPETSDKFIAVGGMVSSDTVDFKSPSAKGLEKNPVIKIMQFIWKFCYYGDTAKHEKQTPPDNIVKNKDIPYVDDGNLYHRLDVFYPEGTKDTDKLPVIIDIHGGGWMYATKDLNEYYCLALAQRGYTVFSISYRLAPDVTVNEQIQDCAMALRWISDNMSAYPCDESRITLTGDSAGGQLSLYEAVLAQSEELRGIFETVDPRLNIKTIVLTSPVPEMKQGALSVYTKILWGKDYKSKPTYNYMNFSEIVDFAPSLPPTYLITSSGDSLAHDQTVATYELLKSKGVICDIADYEKINGETLPHVFSVLNPFDEAGVTAIEGALDFVETH